MLTILAFLQLHGADIIQAITGIVSGASVLANFTKTDQDNKAIGFISKVVNLAAVNLPKITAIKPTDSQFNK